MKKRIICENLLKQIQANEELSSNIGYLQDDTKT